MDIWLITGIVGAGLILFAFAMGQSHHWTQDDFIYDFMNFLGSVFLILYAIAGHAWPFVILNTVWALYSLRDLPGDLHRGTVQATVRH